MTSVVVLTAGVVSTNADNFSVGPETPEIIGNYPKSVCGFS